MITLLKDIKEGLSHLFFPHICRCCHYPLSKSAQHICFRCKHDLPFTGFEAQPGNPVEKIFYGRLHIEEASSCLFFNTGSISQQLIHQIKYHNEPELAVELGRIMGHKLLGTNRFKNIDAIIPLPLSRSRERKRGYNQAEKLATGISEIIQSPVLKNVVTRPRATSTQTNKTRTERWDNMKGMFSLTSNQSMHNAHILLVDDVITTGATLEACAETLSGNGAKISIATLAFAMK